MNGQPDKCPHCEALGGVLVEIRDRLAALEAAQGAISVPRERAARMLGMSLTTFEKYVQPYVRVWREGSLRLVPVADLEAFVNRKAERVDVKPRRRAA